MKKKQKQTAGALWVDPEDMWGRFRCGAGRLGGPWTVRALFTVRALVSYEPSHWQRPTHSFKKMDVPYLRLTRGLL